ncbi:MAG: hypothetical protein R3C12_03310 [Planctomycetaceae bacterium]
MHNQGIKGGTILGGENPRHRTRIQGIRGQPVHGFGRDGNETTLAQDISGTFHIGAYGSMSAVHSQWGFQPGFKRPEKMAEFVFSASLLALLSLRLIFPLFPLFRG